VTNAEKALESLASPSSTSGVGSCSMENLTARVQEFQDAVKGIAAWVWYGTYR
jgi:hypothetical protein